jgi:hypothetical protein
VGSPRERYTVAQGIGKGESTVVILGDAVFTHAQEIMSALSEALDACDHLIIDVGKVVAYDGTFRVLLCSLHRRSELVRKTISMKGTLPGLRNVYIHRCAFNGTNQRCTLWESVVQEDVQLDAGVPEEETRWSAKKLFFPVETRAFVGEFYQPWG